MFMVCFVLLSGFVMFVLFDVFRVMFGGRYVLGVCVVSLCVASV